MGIEIGMTENVGSPATDRVEELCDDMEDGFSDLRSKVQEMDADELRREMSLLMMIGNSQMATIHRLRHDVDEMDCKLQRLHSERIEMDRRLQRLHSERAEFERVTRELADAMGIPFDPDDWNPAKLVRMATTMVEKYSERHMPTFVTEAPADRRESRVEVATVVALSVFVVCVVVWTVLMVSAWVR